MDWNPAQAIELFHLAFLEVLQRRLDQRRYILKGGANLRYFFGSIRYSEDIDLDITGVASWDLEGKIDDILDSPPLSYLLRSGSISIGETSKPKQTETTQRWKIGLTIPGRDALVRTKIEFSRRNGDDRYLLEAVPGEVVAAYALPSPTIQHYLAPSAVEQKVEALAFRSTTQARDVFDLDLLLRKDRSLINSLRAAPREQAADRALNLSFAAFSDQVLEFLDPEIRELYETEDAWLRLRDFVVELLLEDS